MSVEILIGDAVALRRMYWEQGLSIKEIGRLLGTPHNTVLSRMRRWGIPRRSRGEGVRLLAKQGKRKRGPITQSPLKEVLTCNKCGWSWRRDSVQISPVCQKCGSRVEARQRYAKRNVEALLAWRKNNPEKANAAAAGGRKRIRQAALMRVGRGTIACVRCGCNRLELIEIDHVNGGGRKEFKEHGPKLYRMIARHQRDINDLRLLCKVCNALAYLETKHGDLPYTVRWSP